MAGTSNANGGEDDMAQLKIPFDAQRFAKGLTWKDYMAQMGDTRARTEDNYAKSALTEEERKFFSGIGQARYVLMLAENWCGDVHRNSPLIAHICEAMPNCELRVFLRDQNADLRDTFLNNGYQSIPVIVFFDRDWNEIGRWIERSLARRGVRALDPAADLVPVPVEERDDRNGLIALVEIGVAQIGFLVAEEDPELAARNRLADVREQRRVAMHVAAPVLGQHHGVLDPIDAAEELPLVVGQRRLRVVLLGARPGVGHLGHVVLPGQAFGKALGVDRNLQLGHRVSPLLMFDYGVGVRLRAFVIHQSRRPR